MKRISLALAAGAACLAFASVGTATAMPTEGIVNSSCTTSSNFVAGHKVVTTVAGKNIAQSQMKFAECKIVNKVVQTVIKNELMKPKPIEGFHVVPTVVTKAPLVVKYNGLFRGADTATEIRIKFKIEYANN
jgi:hypothetical protein